MAYPVGTQFRMIGRKNDAIWTVVDVWETRNLAGDVVKRRYVAEKPFISGPLRDVDVLETTIARGIVKQGSI